MSADRYTAYAPCPCCDGAGEWDEGPLPASSGASEPDYRQVICPECEGTGRSLVECEPRTLDDLESEEWSADTAAWVASINQRVNGRAA
jgi:hypothetical protein